MLGARGMRELLRMILISVWVDRNDSQLHLVMRMVCVCIQGVVICPSESPIILGFLVISLFTDPFIHSLHVKLYQVRGFPLLARVVACLGFAYCFAGLLINTLLLANTKP